MDPLDTDFGDIGTLGDVSLKNLFLGKSNYT